VECNQLSILYPAYVNAFGYSGAGGRPILPGDTPNSEVFLDRRGRLKCGARKPVLQRRDNGAELFGSFPHNASVGFIKLFVKINENPARKLQPVSSGTLELFLSDFLEKPGAREIPIIIKGGQGNAKNLRRLLVGHASEIPQFDQFGLHGILDAERIKHIVHGQ
jgi:hypothetical protein